MAKHKFNKILVVRALVSKLLPVAITHFRTRLSSALSLSKRQRARRAWAVNLSGATTPLWQSLQYVRRYAVDEIACHGGLLKLTVVLAFTVMLTAAQSLAVPEPATRFIPDGSVIPTTDQSRSDIIALKPDDSVIRPNVAIACGITDTRRQAARCKAASEIGENLNSTEIRVMLDFLSKFVQDQDEYDNLEYNAIKNNISCVFLSQKEPPQTYCSSLVSMYRNPEHDYVWRDYCIQHMVVYCTRFQSNTGEAPLAITYSVFACLEDAAKRIKMPIAGTALLGMAHIAGKDGKLRDVNVSDIAIDVAVNDQACNETRATAMQVAAKLKDRNILPLARQIATSHKDSILRVSAIAAIGKTGNKTDLKKLKNLSNHRDSRISTAARHALRRLKAQHEVAKK